MLSVIAAVICTLALFAILVIYHTVTFDYEKAAIEKMKAIGRGNYYVKKEGTAK